MNPLIHSYRNTIPRLLAAACAAFLVASTLAQVPGPSVSPNSAAIPSDSPAGAGTTQSTTSVTTAPVAAPTTDSGAEPSQAEMMQMMEEMAS